MEADRKDFISKSFRGVTYLRYLIKVLVTDLDRSNTSFLPPLVLAVLVPGACGEAAPSTLQGALEAPLA